MKQAFTDVEFEQVQPEYPLALDYILHNNDEENYHEKLRKNALRVRMKNAVMQTWSSIKSDRSPPSMNELIEGILKKSKDKGKS